MAAGDLLAAAVRSQGGWREVALERNEMREPPDRLGRSKVARPARRRWGRGEVAAAVLAAFAGAVVVWQAARRLGFGDAPEELPIRPTLSAIGQGDVEETAAGAAARRDVAAADATGIHESGGRSPAPQRAPFVPSGFECFDEDIERSVAGGVRWSGLVVDRAGAPVTAAELWHAGHPIGSSDAAGRFDLEVALPAPFSYFRGGASEDLVGWHPAVGSGSVRLGPQSAEVQLRLDWDCRISGTTVATDSGRAVADVSLELMAFSDFSGQCPVFKLTGRSDAEGRWSFPGLPPWTVALRARGDEFASAGWFTFVIADRAEVTGIAFELMPWVTVRGWFTPWPPRGAGGEVAAAGGAARLVIEPATGSVVAAEFERIEAPLAADGSFAVRVPGSFDCRLNLVLDGLPWWSSEVVVDPERREIDLGRIELEPAQEIEVRSSLSREVVALGLEVIAPPNGAGFLSLRRALAADGTARLSVPHEAVERGLQLELRFAPASGLGEGRRITRLARSDEGAFEIAPFAAGAVGGVGRVTLPDGSAVANADVALCVESAAGVHAFGDASTDGAGRYLLRGHAWERSGAAAPVNRIELRVVHLRGFARQTVAPGRIEPGSFWRIDAVLTPAAPLRGVLLAADGTPVAHRYLVFEPVAAGAALDVAHCEDGYLLASCVTDATGRFQVPSEGPGPFRVWCHRGGRAIEPLTLVERSPAPLELRLDAPEARREARRSDAPPGTVTLPGDDR